LLIVLGLAQRDHRHLIVEFLLNASNGIQLIFECGALLHHPLRARGIVPEVGVLGLLVQFGKAYLRRVKVKDASSAARPTA
jgi:hypothetical protein